MLPYWIGFNHVKGIGPVRLKSLIKEFGDVERAWNASKVELEGCGIRPRAVDALIETRKNIDLDREVAKLNNLGVRVLTFDDEDYPSRLREIDAAPMVLFIRGEIRRQDNLAVAVVGTRKPTSYGRSVAKEVSSYLSRNGITIISGMARGIDGIAHRAALDAGGRTIAVLGSGIDQIYPPEHRRLAGEIESSGAIMTNYPLGTKPEGGNFPPRNRIISGLSLAVVVVEAGARSGALITADFAAEQGRDVFAVPGEIYRSASKGTNSLIQAGAHPLLQVEDVIEMLQLELVARQEIASTSLPHQPTEHLLIGVLGDDPTHIDALQETTGLSSAEISAALAMLELKGEVRQVGGMNFVRTREGRIEYRVD